MFARKSRDGKLVGWTASQLGPAVAHPGACGNSTGVAEPWTRLVDGLGAAQVGSNGFRARKKKKR